MNETFTIVNGIYDKDVTERFFEMNRRDQTRGHSKNIHKGNYSLNLRKHSFKNRVTDIWNDLPQELVQAKTVKSFEILLDKYYYVLSFDLSYSFQKIFLSHPYHKFHLLL
jgi:hypothetical protein